MKPFSQACENNKDPIVNILKQCLAQSRSVLEIGSGTGQHAVYFAKHLPHLCWQPSDLAQHHAGIQAWLDECDLANLQPPIILDIDNGWPDGSYDAVFSANTAHIISWIQVRTMIHNVAQLLELNGLFVLYGPFNYEGRFTSVSNENFDQWLKVRDPLSGLRDFEAVNDVARSVGLTLCADHAMPANNRTLVWQKTG